MAGGVVQTLRQVQTGLQSLGFCAVVAFAGVGVALNGLAIAGVLPWPDLALSYGGLPVPFAGMIAQLFITALLLVLCFYLPANARMARLERSHRSFQISMEDVKRAYSIAHAADRTGVFSLSNEFESMRERMELMRKHPDLGHLEPELLQIAAQMSYQSRELARAYSDERVDRAKGFLQSRQQEAQQMQDRIHIARITCDNLRRWLTDVEVEERTNHLQIRQLEADLREVLPALGYDFEDRDANIVSLPKPSKDSLNH